MRYQVRLLRHVQLGAPMKPRKPNWRAKLFAIWQVLRGHSVLFNCHLKLGGPLEFGEGKTFMIGGSVTGGSVGVAPSGRVVGR